MKRKLITRNKKRISRWLKLKPNNVVCHRIENRLTFDDITRIKKRGQDCYERRIKRQEKLNPRRLKKLRQKQRLSGLIGSKHGGMCKIQLKPAAALFKK
jgi:hypothetical protein